MKTENHKQFSHRRDNALVEIINEWRAINTKQISLLWDYEKDSWLFPGDLFTVQRRLQIKLKQGKIKRTIVGDKNYIYYIDKPKQIEHVVGVSWCRLWVEKRIIREFKRRLIRWEYEEPIMVTRTDKKGAYQFIRPDAIFVAYDPVKKVYPRYFLEYETGSKPCTKVEDYIRFYEQVDWTKYWWAKFAQGFPTVLIVTEGDIQKIKDDLAHFNNRNLDIRPYSANKIREEVECSKKQTT